MSENVTQAIDYLTEAVEGFTGVFAILGSVGIVFFLILIFGIGAWWMTCCMFSTRNPIPGYISAILWVLMGAVFYQIPDMIDGDWFWAVNWWRIPIAIPFIVIGVMMMFAANGLRTKKEDIQSGDEFIDEGKDDVKFIDEGGGSDSTTDDDEKPSAKLKALRDRADRRRSHYGDV